MGILAEYGWAHRVTPFLFIFCARTTDLELGSTVCPLLVIFGNDHNTAALDLQPKKRARREPAPRAHQASQDGLCRLLHLCLACSGVWDKEGLWSSLQRHREELVPGLAADLLGMHTQQHLRVFKLIHNFLQLPQALPFQLETSIAHTPGQADVE